MVGWRRSRNIPKKIGECAFAIHAVTTVIEANKPAEILDTCIS